MRKYLKKFEIQSERVCEVGTSVAKGLREVFFQSQQIYHKLRHRAKW